MQRINTADHLFHDGDPFNGVQGTAVKAAFLNSVQEEIAKVIEQAGIPLDSSKNDQLLTALSALYLSVNPTTQPIGDKTAKAATDAFVASALGDSATINVAGSANVVLTQAQWGCAILTLTGVITGNISVIFPAAGDQWKVVNQTTGDFSITLTTSTGIGIVIPRGSNYDIWCVGANIQTSSATSTTLAPSLYFFGQL